MTTRRAFVCTLIAVAILALAVRPARAAEDTTGKVTIETMSAAAGLGYTWGAGVLEYRGQRYPFTVKGFSIVDVGVAKRVARGEVYGLKNAEDFEGTFMAAVASGTLGGGAGAGAMKNQNEVDVVWTSTNQGLNFSLAHAGINVKFTDEGRALAAKTRRSPAEVDPAAAPGLRSPR
jgi:hypothetical protein